MDGTNDGRQLLGVFKQHFTFAMALTAAQRAIKSEVQAVVPYMLACCAFIVVAQSTRPRAGPLVVLSTQAIGVATQLLSSMLGAWLTAVVGDSANSGELIAVASIGLVLVWIAERSLQ
jgi:hypothetical protein